MPHTNPSVIRNWVEQAEHSARSNHSGSLYFEGPTLYSYGSHFPIATIITTPKNNRFVAFTDRTYSNTTSHHKSLALSMLAKDRIIYTANPPWFADNILKNPATIARLLQIQYRNALIAAARARTRKHHHFRNADRIWRSAEWLADQYDCPILAFHLPTDLPAAARQALEAHEKATLETITQWRLGKTTVLPNPQYLSARSTQPPPSTQRAQST